MMKRDDVTLVQESSKDDFHRGLEILYPSLLIVTKVGNSKPLDSAIVLTIILLVRSVVSPGVSK